MNLTSKEASYMIKAESDAYKYFYINFLNTSSNYNLSIVIFQTAH